MSFSKKIIIILIFVLCFLSMVYYIGGKAVQDENQFMMAVVDKQKRLAEITSPKAVFVGGSNLTFGVDSKEISKSIKMPVVNMAIHGGLGLDFMLKEASENIKKGDIIFISTEYFLDKQGDIKLQAMLFDSHPSLEKYCINNFNDRIILRVINLQRIMSSLFFKYILKLPLSDDVYSKQQFSKEGDIIGHLEAKQPLNQTGRGQGLTVDYSLNIDLLNSFVMNAQSQGAKVFYLFPCHPKSQYELNKIAIDDFELQMKSKLKCQILNSPKTFLFADEYMFDTIYHLNKEGRKLRTKLLCDIIQKVL